ncbi:MAG: GNAT family N-acetyltransferase [Flavisolibacter sp.]
MMYREARVADIPQLQRLRRSVKENVLSDPALVRDQDYVDYLEGLGRGWVCASAEGIRGFAIAGLQNHHVWALFVEPGQEGRGIGSRLHDLMLEWYFSQTEEPIWLSTAPRTKAERFYRKRGWRETGRQPNGEIRFILQKEDWKDFRPV